MTQSHSEDGIDWKAVAIELADHLLHYEPRGALQAAIRRNCDLRDQAVDSVKPGAIGGRQDTDGVDVGIG